MKVCPNCENSDQDKFLYHKNVGYDLEKCEKCGYEKYTDTVMVYADEITQEEATYEAIKLPKNHFPFQPNSPVLVRNIHCIADERNVKWQQALFIFKDLFTAGHPLFFVYGIRGGIFREGRRAVTFNRCISFSGNEHLLGTTEIPTEQHK